MPNEVVVEIVGIPALVLGIGVAIVGALGLIYGSIVRAFTTHLKRAATEAFVGMRQTAVQRVNDFIAWLRGLPARARAALAQMRTQMRQVGRDIITGIINGVSGAASRLYNNLRNMARNALNSAKEALGISSPSRVFRDEVGAEIVAGLLGGISAGQGQVDRALADLVSARPTVGQVRVPVSAEVSQHAAAQQQRAATAQQEQLRAEVRSTDLLERLLAAVRAQGDGSVVIEVDSKEIARANRKGEHSLARR
jgi:phage-related protein